MAESLPDVEALGPEDLKGLVLQLLEEVAALRAETAVLREEIGRLKGLTGRPKIEPSGMDKEWRRLYRSHPPKRTGRDLLARAITYKLQERVRSLSRIARRITGTHWSGPRFFGLKRKPEPFAGHAEEARHE